MKKDQKGCGVNPGIWTGLMMKVKMEVTCDSLCVPTLTNAGSGAAS